MGTRIVIIDNQQSVRDLLSGGFNEVGWEVFGYTYSQIGLPTLKKHQPDLVILDFETQDHPVAWEFLKLIKTNETTARTPIIVTAPIATLATEIQRYLFIKYIPMVAKPFDIERLFACVHDTLKQAQQANTLLTSDPSLPVLIVNDSEDLREAIAFLLEMEHYRVITAANGLLALGRLYDTDFCLILLDIDMPVMNGYEFMGAYEQQLRPHAPVVVVTGRGDLPNKRLPYFVADKLAKPCSASELFGVLNRVLNQQN